MFLGDKSMIDIYCTFSIPVSYTALCFGVMSTKRNLIFIYTLIRAIHIQNKKSIDMK